METNVNTLVHPRQPWLEAIRSARDSAEPVPGRPYFRCHPLVATLSVQQCRANRAKVSTRDALTLAFELPSWQLRPGACERCVLAGAVEAGDVIFYTAEEVLSGLALASDSRAVALPRFN